MIKVHSYKRSGSTLLVTLVCDCNSGKILKRKEGSEIVFRCGGCNTRTTASLLMKEASSFYWRSLPWEFVNVEEDHSTDLFHPVSIPSKVTIYDLTLGDKTLNADGRIIKLGFDGCAVLFDDDPQITGLLAKNSDQNPLSLEIIVREAEHEIELYGKLSSVHPYGKSTNSRLAVINYLFLREYQKKTIEHLIEEYSEEDEEALVLLVLQNPTLLKVAKTALREQNTISYAVSSDLDDIIEMMKKKTYHLVVIPYKDSWIDGMRWFEKIRAQNSIIGCVFVFEQSQQQMVIEGFRQGAEDCLVVPFAPKIFTTTLNKALEKLKSRQAIITHEVELAAQLKEKTEMLSRSFAALDDSFTKIETAYYETVQKLCLAAECHDEGTASHIRRISEYSKIISQNLGWGEHKIEIISLASPMHDIGKVGISEHILTKCSGLTDEEWSEVRKHPQLGARILRGSDSPILQMAELISLQHHERFDGSGYPGSIKGDDIPEEARVVNIADVFDSLTTKRPYKPPWPNTMAISYLVENKGVQFHPIVVDAFLKGIDQILEVQKQYKEEETSYMEDRRHFQRVHWESPMTIKVLLPEETFRPKEMECVSFDICESGIGVRFKKLSPDFYNLLKKTTRYLEGEIMIPGSKEKTSFRGRIAWIDNFSSYANQECKMGIEFTKVQSLMKDAILSYIETQMAVSEEKKVIA